MSQSQVRLDKAKSDSGRTRLLTQVFHGGWLGKRPAVCGV